MTRLSVTSELPSQRVSTPRPQANPWQATGPATASAVPGATAASKASGLKRLIARLPQGQRLLDAAGRVKRTGWARHLKTSTLMIFAIDLAFSATKGIQAAKDGYKTGKNPIEGALYGARDAAKVFGKSMAGVTGGLFGMHLAGAGLAAAGVASPLAGLALGMAGFAAGHWLVDQFIHKREQTPSEAIRQTVSTTLGSTLNATAHAALDTVSNPFAQQNSNLQPK